MSHATRWFTLGIAILVVGCRDQSPRPVPVTGVVTFESGPCPAPGNIIFAPKESAGGGGAKPQPGEASFGVDGAFTARTIAIDGPGLFPGTYRVHLECWAEGPTESSPGRSHLPANFQPPDIVVPANRNEPVMVFIQVPAK